MMPTAMFSRSTLLPEPVGPVTQVWVIRPLTGYRHLALLFRCVAGTDGDFALARLVVHQVGGSRRDLCWL